MKIIKKIAAIMLSVMMVLGMCSVVGAAETSGSYGDNDGKITIQDAKKDQTYTIYRILKLESFSRGDDRDKGNYAYKVEDGWEKFVNNTSTGGAYLIKDPTSGYVTWNSAKTADSDKAAFAKAALEYATDSSNNIVNTGTVKAAGETVQFTGLNLGYYLVDSSAGALCSLDTTNPDVTIKEKNGVPSVDKVVKSADGYKDNNTASIGDTVEFKTTIIAQPGAQNYVLHDKMDAGLTFDNTSIKINLMKNGETKESLVGDTNYTIKTSGLESENPCTFHIEFKQDFCDTLKANDQIIITYSATLNESAVIAGEGNKNGTWLKYGDSSETNHDETTTKTFEIPVFKYTKDASGTGAETGLKDAQFILKKRGEASGMGLEKVTPTPTGKEGIVYCYKKNAAETIVTTDDTGKFTIQGLAPGAYKLVEKEAPKGYNKLSAPVEITIGNDGKVSYNTETNATWVKVENKTGSLLPSTGGMGTTLFYIFGAILVIGSGVVLITKKRMK